jgi:PAS domain S-box-containing protein
VARDISARKQAETVLRTSEAKLSNAMEMARLGYWEYDAMSDLFTFNDQFYAMLHTTVERVGGYTMSPDSYAQRFIHPDDVPVVRLGIQRARDTAARHYSRELEHRIIYGDGGIGHITVRVFIVKDDHGRTIKTYGVNQDITKRKRAEEALQRSEERYRRLADASFEGIGLITEGTILDLNDQLATMVQGTRSTMIGKDISHFVAPESRDIARRHMQSGCETPHEFLALRTDGSTFPVEARARSVTTDEGRIWVIAIRDITDRKLAERQLVSSLREKEMLLKEIHHRVKNNMQVVSSLLSLGTQKISDPAARGTLQASMNRIRSMALVHETLYRSENFAAIDFKEYLRRETRSLVHSLGKPGVTCAVGGDNIQLPLDTALPCGLVVNELVTNALAHAYPDYRTGTIDVSLSRSDNGRVELTVRDDGVGLPPDSDIKTLASLGMTLVFTLVEQISGTITLDGRNGTRVVVSFPVEYTTLRPHNFPGYRPPAPEAVCRGEKGNA